MQRRELEASLPESQPEPDEDSNVQEVVEMEYGNDNKESSNSRESLPQRAAPPPKKPRARDIEKMLRAKNERRQKKQDNTDGALDPMDPAAYSDIPR